MLGDARSTSRRRLQKNSSARHGVSLFEAIAALAIVALTTISALSVVGSELRTTEKARRALEVEALLAERVGMLPLLTDRDLQRLPDTVAQGRFPEPLNAYQWTTASAPSISYPGLYDIELSVVWANGRTTVNTAQYRRPPLATSRRR